MKSTNTVVQHNTQHSCFIFNRSQIQSFAQKSSQSAFMPSTEMMREYFQNDHVLSQLSQFIIYCHFYISHNMTYEGEIS